MQDRAIDQPKNQHHNSGQCKYKLSQTWAELVNCAGAESAYSCKTISPENKLQLSPFCCRYESHFHFFQLTVWMQCKEKRHDFFLILLILFTLARHLALWWIKDSHDTVCAYTAENLFKQSSLLQKKIQSLRQRLTPQTTN